MPNTKEFLETVKSFNNQPLICIFDDLGHILTSANCGLDIDSLVTTWSHHLNVTCFFLFHHLFGSPQLRKLSLSCHYFILLDSPRDKSSIGTFARQAFPNNSKFIIDSYNDATSKKYGHLLVSLKPPTNKYTQVCSQILDDNPVCYIPYNGSFRKMYLISDEVCFFSFLMIFLHLFNLRPMFLYFFFL